MNSRRIESIIYWFGNLPIKRKLWITQFISMVIPLLLISLVLSGYELYSSQQQLLNDTQVMANILGENSSAALVFEDKKTAEELLQSLRFNPAIISAALYLPDGQLFAAYYKDKISIVSPAHDSLLSYLELEYYDKPIIRNIFRTDGSFFKSSLTVSTHLIGWRDLELLQPIELPDKSVAVIRFLVSFEFLYQRLLRFISVISLIILTALAVAMLLMDRLQNVITQPLLELTGLMCSVSRQRDYTHRAKVIRHDEVGLLAQGFNIMLRVIEQHQEGLDRELRERNKAEQKLYAAHLELHERHKQIETAYQELARAHEHLIHSEKMASLGLLMAGVAHELNNPISYVSSNLEFIEEYTESLARIIEAYSGLDARLFTSIGLYSDEFLSSARVDKTLKTLRELIISSREGAERVKKIVLDLKVFSRTDDIGCMSTKLQEGIESTLKFLATQYRDRITLHRDYSNLPLVECYPSHINQVFMNLLQNSIQSIPGKGDIWIRTELNNDWVKIIIKDNGSGIAKDDLIRIFDPFFTTKPVGMGTGLGLSISYGIIKNHGGKIQVNSKINEGTEFIIELPVFSIRSQ